METLVSWPIVPLMALAVPVTLALAAAAAPRRAGLASAGALAWALLFSLGSALVGDGPAGAGTTLGVRVDAATCVMLLLVAGLGAAIVRFSRTYLDGDAGLFRYFRWLLSTLSAVAGLVLTDNLLVMVLFWTATSLALHQLLTFYADRPAALVVAHKKFLVSRLADACLAASVALVYTNVGSFGLDRITAWVEARPGLPLSMDLAAVLLVIAVALRSAQLPFHGWLTQVMEAPTPVSALLHAGVVNIGGFVLIRLAPWIAQAEAARFLLLAIGLASTIVAALVMTTRVSVKVALAWSTCAQMGFMLVQCALGLWPLALLHLVAHSLYKAHAFLSAGSAVDDWKKQASTAPPPPGSPRHLGVAALFAVGSGILAVTLLRPYLGFSTSHQPSDVVLALLVGLSVSPLLAGPATIGSRAAAPIALYVAGIVLLYLGWHGLAAQLLPPRGDAAGAVGWTLTALGFAALFVVKTAVQLRPGGKFARALHPWLFSGLYLDEIFTRLTFRVWPPRLLRGREAERRAFNAPATLEAQA